MSEQSEQPEQSQGQVSESGGLSGEPISDGDYTAGDPEAHTDNAGPDAVPEANRRDNEMTPDDHQLGESIEDEP